MGRGMNAIHWTARAARQLRKLDRQHQRVLVEAVGQLEAMPHCRQVRALREHRYGYRLRVGDYRVLSDWDDGIRIVDIQEVSKRDERTYRH
ncbi:cytotoxic translational repressor of toxin-antitoxin stability system [Ralstonia solanacearum]|nr:cytotoxic translational repressor of toxin-antitoxin stability system [Ralstonia solanacearum]MCK4152717.1 type II toxin-antitoxin system RelE/ParE family toxin [Ralstonia pseudosolanacearum]AXW13752.1 cytotoxic translational repressor of toxin-antitoxin stability system [Ralstonia solanacearum]AXW36966.1 cytotoxic translational repressor of toxin-antitoxin stability system [Ralstonia solanacearum]AXW69835.1 cytotoxic translational repressor of toxin-antitoxin stability system [Ralstonia sol